MAWLRRPNRFTVDTGLTEIGPLLDGYVSGSLTLLRMGQLVQLSARGLVLSKVGLLYDLPDGYRPPSQLIWNQREDFTANGPRIFIEAYGRMNFVSTPVNTPIYSMFLFLTRQQPPT